MTSSATNQYAVVVCLLLVFSRQPINAKPANPSQPMGSGSVSQDYMDLQAILGHRLSGSTEENVKIVDLLLQLLEEIDLPTLCDVIANDTSGLKSNNEMNLEENVKDKKTLPTESAETLETAYPTISTSSSSVAENEVDTSAMPEEMKELHETGEEIENMNEESEEIKEEEKNISNEEDKQVQDINNNDEESIVNPTVKDHQVDMHTSPYWSTRRPLRRRVILRPRGLNGRISSDGTLPFPGGKRRTFRRVKLGDLKKVWLPVSKIDGVSLPSPINNIDMHSENDESKRYLIKRFNLPRPRSALYSGSLVLGGEKFVKEMNPALDEKTMKRPSMLPTRAESENEIETNEIENGGKMSKRPKGKVVRRIIYRKKKGDKGVKRGPVRYKVVRRVSPHNTAEKTLRPAERKDVAKIMYLKRQAMRQQLYRGKTGRMAGGRYKMLRNGGMRGVPKKALNPIRPRRVRIPRKFDFYNIKSNRPYHQMVNNKRGYRIQRYPATKQNVYEKPESVASDISPSVQSPPETTFSARAVVYPTVITSMEVMTTGSETVLPVIEMTRDPKPSPGSISEKDDFTNNLIENDGAEVILDLDKIEKNGRYKVLQPLINYEDIDNVVEPFAVKGDKMMEYKLSENQRNQFEPEGENDQESSEGEIHEKSDEDYEQVSNSITEETSQNNILLSDTASVQQSLVKATISHTDASTGTPTVEKVMDTTIDQSNESIVGDDLLQSATNSVESNHTRYEGIDTQNIAVEEYQISEQNIDVLDLSPEFTLTSNSMKTDIEKEPKTTITTVEKEPRTLITTVGKEPRTTITTVEKEPRTTITTVEKEPRTTITTVEKEPRTTITTVGKENMIDNKGEEENVSVISVMTEFGNGSSLVAESRIISVENSNNTSEQTTLTFGQNTGEFFSLKSDVTTPIATTKISNGMDTHAPIKQEVGETSPTEQSNDVDMITHVTKDHNLKVSNVSVASLPKTSNISLKTDSTTIASNIQVPTEASAAIADEEENEPADALNETLEVIDVLTEEITQLPTQTPTKPEDVVNGESNVISSEISVDMSEKDYKTILSKDSNSDLTDSITVTGQAIQTVDKTDTSEIRHVLISPYMPALGELIYENEISRPNETSSNEIESVVKDVSSEKDVTSTAAPNVKDENAFQRPDENTNNEFLTVSIDEERKVLLPIIVTSPDLILPDTTQSTTNKNNDKSITTDGELNPTPQEQTTGISDMLSSFSNYISTQLFSDEEVLDSSTIATKIPSSSQEPLTQTMEGETKMSRDDYNPNVTTAVNDNDQTRIMNETDEISESSTVVINTSTYANTPKMKSNTHAPTVATTHRRPSSKVPITTTSKPSAITTTPSEMSNVIPLSSTSKPHANVTMTPMPNTNETDELNSRHMHVSQSIEMKSNSSDDANTMDNNIINDTEKHQTDNENVLVVSHTIHVPGINNSYESLTNEISNTASEEMNNNGSKVQSAGLNNTEQIVENRTTTEHVKTPTANNGVHTKGNTTEKENINKNIDHVNEKNESKSDTDDNEEEIYILPTSTDGMDQKLPQIILNENTQNKQDTDDLESDSTIEMSATLKEKGTVSEAEILNKQNDIERSRWYEKSDLNKFNNRFADWQKSGSVSGEALKLAGLKQLAGLHGMKYGDKPRTSVYNKLGSETLNKYQNTLTGEYLPPKTGNIDLWKAYNIAVNQGENNQAYNKGDFEKYVMWNAVPWAKSMPASGQPGQTRNAQSKHNGQEYRGGFPGISGAVDSGVTGYVHPDLGYMNSPYSHLGKVHEDHWGNRFSQGFYGRVYDGSQSTSAENSHRAGVSNQIDDIDNESGLSIEKGTDDERNESEDEENVSSPQVVISKNGKNDDFGEEELRKMLSENTPLYDPKNELKSFETTLVQKPKLSSKSNVNGEDNKKDKFVTERPNRPAAAQMVVESGQWPNSETTGQIGVPAPGDYTCRGMFGYHKDPNDCQSFFICSWGIPYRLHCPPGTRFNPKQSVCDWAVNVDCPNGHPPL